MELKINDALYRDFHKPPFETYVTEIGLVVKEIRNVVRRLPRWSRPERVPTPVVHFPARSFIYREPYGTVLIVSPWNYPLLLSLSPLIGAIAAGNTVMLKIAPAAAHTARLLADLVGSVFPKEYVAVFQGHRDVNRALLKERYDYLFFTGGEKVGRYVMQAAARHLTPLTLELGGKCPVMVHRDADLRHAARRIAWGKFMNGGQTCVAPDYLLAHQDIAARVLEHLSAAIRSFYGERPQTSNDYCRIVSDHHFLRLKRLLASGKIHSGGQNDRKERFIAPTLLTDVSFDDPVMQEEIFGPILPVITYRDVDQVIGWVRSRPEPLAFYLFTQDNAVKNRLWRELAFGGGCLNDTVMQLANPHLAFGGVGRSGLGRYHGRAGYETFTYAKSLFDKSTRIDLPFRYPPYTHRALSLVKKFLR